MPLRVYARLRFIRVRWINSPLATRRFQVRIVSSKTRPGFLLKTRSSRCWAKSCAALSVTFSGPICRAQQYRPKRLKTVRSAGFAPDLQRSSQASVRGTLMLGTGRSAPVSLRARRTSLLILRQRAGDRRRAPGDARSNNVFEEGLQIGPDPVRGAFEHVAEPPYGRAHVLPGLCAQLFKFGEFVEHPGQGSRRRQNR